MVNFKGFLKIAKTISYSKEALKKFLSLIILKTIFLAFMERGEEPSISVFIEKLLKLLILESTLQ